MSNSELKSAIVTMTLVNFHVVLPKVACVEHLEEDVGLACIGQLGIVDLTAVEGGPGRDLEPTTNRVVFSLEHG